ncbi:hypothetical protein O9G_002859 [Rozella allomycis CSF55]|uniref:Uncharacterized protein n=1 Tax=Rozella allomycis (strain CSF55) TaxID=988480 RepID=A0A075AS44_ROZAC|nr:hypothetical protein O9G_002859 [Rozella allomycis CSF55]|eukprot:EPZ33058.1 hypothetical protein O9G_002859 [Rozella allomycis CSF55]
MHLNILASNDGNSQMRQLFQEIFGKTKGEIHSFKFISSIKNVQIKEIPASLILRYVALDEKNAYKESIRKLLSIKQSKTREEYESMVKKLPDYSMFLSWPIIVKISSNPKDHSSEAFRIAPNLCKQYRDINIDAVSLEQSKPEKIALLEFKGALTNERNLKRQAGMLEKTLLENEILYDKSFLYTFTYNPPICLSHLKRSGVGYKLVEKKVLFYDVIVNICLY